ncbi:hypothetical protein BN871_JI_00080, partial [Paenibacillus sp. P22]
MARHREAAAADGAAACMMDILEELARIGAEEAGTELPGTERMAAGTKAQARMMAAGPETQARTAAAEADSGGSGERPGKAEARRGDAKEQPGMAGVPAGVTRLLYDEAWLDAQRHLEARLAGLGLETRWDRTGSLYGRLPGRDGGRTILTGSHVDTVRRGGRYDGAYGIAAGIAALDALNRLYGPPRRTLEVVSLCEEEGSRFPLSYWGSGNLTGRYGPADAGRYRDADGATLEEAMHGAGFGGESLPDPRRHDLDAFVELHIEQGVVLERTGDDVGIVEAIVGQRRYAMTLAGEANHAGT